MRSGLRNRDHHWRRRPGLPHAVRVAAITAAVIGMLLAVLCATFDLVESRRLISQVDSRLRQHLAEVRQLPVTPTAVDPSDTDADVAPVFTWKLAPTGHVTVQQAGAPPLPARASLSSTHPVTRTLGGGPFRLLASTIPGGRLVVGQSLEETDHIESELATAETMGGPVLVVAMFLGALAIGLKASRPIEEARRRELEFTADASHELRTPLTVIEAEVALALGTNDDAGNRQVLERIRAEGGRLRRIVEDLLWLARLDSQPPSRRDELVDLVTLTERCALRFETVARANGTQLSLAHDPDSPLCINASPDEVDRLLGVLMDNACRYAGPQGQIEISVVAGRGGRVAVVVEDSGPGIPVSERPRLFDRFHRGTDRGTGAGLGLAIADAIVRAGGGRWHIGDSDLGGARFEVSWHRAKVPHIRASPARGSE